MQRVFYTDGSTKHNGKPNAIGSYAWVEVKDNEVIRSFASCKDPSDTIPTNSRMEILAVISALHHCKAGDTVTIYSDSAYVINCMNQGWYKSWERNGVNSQGKIPANLDLWHMLLRATNRMSKVTWIHIKGHNGNKFNELCDELAGKLTSSKNRADIYYEY